MIDAERNQVVAVSPQRLIRIQFRDLDRKTQPIKAELFGATEHARRAARAPQSKHVCAALERHRPHKADDADDVVRMEVREEHIGESERHVITHHLPLSSFAAIEQQRLALAH